MPFSGHGETLLIPPTQRTIAPIPSLPFLASGYEDLWIILARVRRSAVVRMRPGVRGYIKSCIEPIRGSLPQALTCRARLLCSPASRRQRNCMARRPHLRRLPHPGVPDAQVHRSLTFFAPFSPAYISCCVTLCASLRT